MSAWVIDAKTNAQLIGSRIAKARDAHILLHGRRPESVYLGRSEMREVREQWDAWDKSFKYGAPCLRLDKNTAFGMKIIESDDENLIEFPEPKEDFMSELPTLEEVIANSDSLEKLRGDLAELRRRGQSVVKEIQGKHAELERIKGAAIYVSDKIQELESGHIAEATRTLPVNDLVAKSAMAQEGEPVDFAEEAVCENA